MIPFTAHPLFGHTSPMTLFSSLWALKYKGELQLLSFRTQLFHLMSSLAPPILSANKMLMFFLYGLVTLYGSYMTSFLSHCSQNMGAKVDVTGWLLWIVQHSAMEWKRPCNLNYWAIPPGMVWLCHIIVLVLIAENFPCLLNYINCTLTNSV